MPDFIEVHAARHTWSTLALRRRYSSPTSDASSGDVTLSPRSGRPFGGSTLRTGVHHGEATSKEVH